MSRAVDRSIALEMESIALAAPGHFAWSTLLPMGCAISDPGMVIIGSNVYVAAATTSEHFRYTPDSCRLACTAQGGGIGL